MGQSISHSAWTHVEIVSLRQFFPVPIAFIIVPSGAYSEMQKSCAQHGISFSTPYYVLRDAFFDVISVLGPSSEVSWFYHDIAAWCFDNDPGAAAVGGGVFLPPICLLHQNRDFPIASARWNRYRYACAVGGGSSEIATFSSL